MAQQLHALKHEGLSHVLAEVAAVRDRYPQEEELSKKVADWQKPEQQMQYPDYHEQGWPIGSGMVESANKHVVQARLQGAGMHWQRRHVNPMLALRTAACNQRGPEAWQQSAEHGRTQRMQRRIEQKLHRYEQVVRATLCYALFLHLRLRKPKPSKSACCPSAHKPAGPARPAADHPWRRRLLAKK